MYHRYIAAHLRISRGVEGRGDKEQVPVAWRKIAFQGSV